LRHQHVHVRSFPFEQFPKTSCVSMNSSEPSWPLSRREHDWLMPADGQRSESEPCRSCGRAIH
jgi:hypothetical protein